MVLLIFTQSKLLSATLVLHFSLLSNSPAFRREILLSVRTESRWKKERTAGGEKSTFCDLSRRENRWDSGDAAAESPDPRRSGSSRFGQRGGTGGAVLLPSCTSAAGGFLHWRGLLPCVCTAASGSATTHVLRDGELRRLIIAAGRCRCFSLTYLYMLYLTTRRKQNLPSGTGFSFPARSRAMKTEVFIVKRPFF